MGNAVGGLVICAILALVLMVLLASCTAVVGDWIGLMKADAAAAKAAADADKANANARIAEAEVEQAKVEVQGRWVDSLTTRIDAATLLPYLPVVSILLILAPAVGYGIGSIWPRLK